MTTEQFIESLALQWKYAVKVFEYKDTKAFVTILRFKSNDGYFTAEYRINTSYWETIKPRIIKKSDSLK